MEETFTSGFSLLPLSLSREYSPNSRGAQMDEEAITFLMDAILSPQDRVQFNEHQVSDEMTVKCIRAMQTSVKSNHEGCHAKPRHPYESMRRVHTLSGMPNSQTDVPLYEQMTGIFSTCDGSLVDQNTLPYYDEKPFHPYQRMVLNKASSESFPKSKFTSNRVSAVFGSARTTERSASLIAQMSSSTIVVDTETDIDKAARTRSPPSNTERKCNCKRNKCLKLYCCCFAAVS
jgi:hypothetical protein